ncbi:MAG: ABC transporter permease [Clostridia bacterium]|nr:ABC transporter permease [Clostridia bacterium]
MFKLNRAELKKIFLRPAVYLMLFVLALALVVSTFLYAPETKVNPTTSFGGVNQTVAMAFSEFKTTTSTDGKTSLDESLADAKAYLENFSGQESLKNSIQEKLNAIHHSLTYNNGDSEQTFDSALWDYSALQTNENRNALIEEVQEISTLSESVYDICKNQINAQTIDFYISAENLAVIEDYAKNLYLAIPTIDSLNEFNQEALLEFADNIKINYLPTEALAVINSANKIEFSQEKVEDILEKYYTPVAFSADGVLKEIYDEMQLFVTENADEDSTDKLAEFNTLATKYKLATQNSVSLIESSMVLAKAGDYSDAHLKNFIGFESFNAYLLTEKITTGQFVLDNQLFESNYLSMLGFNTISGYGPSAFDFAIYAMQIVSVILTVFAIFFMASSMAGDFQNGTMKMIASRPISKAKIVAGKTLASINFTFIFALFAFVASLAIGYALFGFGEGQVLAVFNATTAFLVHPAILIAIYFVTMMLGIIFFICLANLFAVIFRSSILSMFLTVIVFVASVILNALSMGATWFMYTPFAYLNLFGYLGGAGAGGFLGFAVPLCANAFIAIGVLFGMIILIDILSKLIFKARDIT